MPDLDALRGELAARLAGAGVRADIALLPICRRIAEEHGGTLEGGPGAEFVLTLPR